MPFSYLLQHLNETAEVKKQTKKTRNQQQNTFPQLSSELESATSYQQEVINHRTSKSQASPLAAETPNRSSPLDTFHLVINTSAKLQCSSVSSTRWQCLPAKVEITTTGRKCINLTRWKNSLGGGEGDDRNNCNQAKKKLKKKQWQTNYGSVCAIIKIFLWQKNVIIDKTLLKVSWMC